MCSKDGNRSGGTHGRSPGRVCSPRWSPAWGIAVSWTNIRLTSVQKYNWGCYWGIKPRGGNILFRTQNLQDWSDCAKNRAPDTSCLVIHVRILVWSKSRSELGDRAHQSWRLEFPYINYNGKIVSRSTSNSGFGVVLNFDALYFQAQRDFSIKLKF